MSHNDIEILKHIAHASSTAVRFFTWMALRERNRGPINVVKTKRHLRSEGEPINDTEFDQALTDLVKAGYGKVIKNHRGEVIYFQFNHPIYLIGKAAIEGRPLPTKQTVYRQEVKRPAVPKKLTLAVSNPTTKTIMYYWTNGKNMKMEFEGEVSRETLEKIIATLQDSKSKTVSN